MWSASSINWTISPDEDIISPFGSSSNISFYTDSTFHCPPRLFR